MTDDKTILRRYLQGGRDALVWKLEGLSDREARLPRTSTGFTLTGVVKHCANVEIGYFGSTFGREWPEVEDACYVPLDAYDEDPQVDWIVPAAVSVAALVDFYRRVWTFADATIEELPLEATGAPPWWGAPKDNQVTLQHMLVRVATELARHAGQADIVREGIDGAAGYQPAVSNLPDDYDWAGYRARLTGLAEASS